MTKDEVMEYITTQATEADLRDINELLAQRFKVLRARNRARVMGQLEPGSLVAFNNDVRPTYLRGSTARVVEFRQTKITVELVHGPVGKFRSGRIVTAPDLVHVIAGPSRLKTIEEVTS